MCIRETQFFVIFNLLLNFRYRYFNLKCIFSKLRVAFAIFIDEFFWQIAFIKFLNLLEAIIIATGVLDNLTSFVCQILYNLQRLFFFHFLVCSRCLILIYLNITFFFLIFYKIIEQLIFLAYMIEAKSLLLEIIIFGEVRIDTSHWLSFVHRIDFKIIIKHFHLFWVNSSPKYIV